MLFEYLYTLPLKLYNVHRCMQIFQYGLCNNVNGPISIYKYIYIYTLTIGNKLQNIYIPYFILILYS